MTKWQPSKPQTLKSNADKLLGVWLCKAYWIILILSSVCVCVCVVWMSVIAKNQGQENAILCFIKKSIGYLITATWFSLVSGLGGTGWSWWVARWMHFPVSDDYLICCCSWRKEELSLPCQPDPGHVCPLPADFNTISDNLHVRFRKFLIFINVLFEWFCNILWVERRCVFSFFFIYCQIWVSNTHKILKAELCCVLFPTSIFCLIVCLRVQFFIHFTLKQQIMA